jgi:DNA-binding NarL/FixJ family response regulator
MHASNKKEQTKVLLVDDDINFTKSAKQCLQMQDNYKIETAFSVDEALHKMTEKEIDIVVCDIQMPVMDGFTFLKMLRESGNNVPFIVFTVTENKETALRAFSLGANGFVGKYGDPEVVFSTLQRCIEKSVNTC